MMFDIPDVKIFKDSVHGYIRIPKCFVENIIDTKLFQRLRNIEQTGMRILYPNAKHDRFSHSLGVFYLGCKAVDALLENFRHENYWNISSDNKRLTFWAKNKVLFLIACLLHDIGHAPFSHSMENIILHNSNSDGNSNFTRELLHKLQENEDWGEKYDKIEAASHEKIGALLVIDKMQESIEAVFDDLIQQKYPSVSEENILYAEHYSYNPVIDKSELKRDICFIARMIMGLKYTGYEPEKQIRNCFIELLNGGNFDVDKLDYVIRDTQMSGISNINVDIERLLSSVCIVTKTRYIEKKGLDKDFSNYVITQLSGGPESEITIKGDFRGDILLKGNAEVEIADGSSFLALIPIEHAKIKYPEYAEAARFSVKTSLFQNGAEMAYRVGTKEEPRKQLSVVGNNEYFDCKIQKAKVLDKNFCFVVQDFQEITGKAIQLQINGYCDVRIKGEFTIKSPITCFQDTRVRGNIKEAILLGNSIEREVPGENAYNEFTVGFKKQAINIIANVLEARNYLYLWVYAHHKVVYYTNFLIPILSSQVLRQAKSDFAEIEKSFSRREESYGKLSELLFPAWSLSYGDIQYLDDSYLWTGIKNYYYRDVKDEAPWAELCEEILSRKYKASLYKSLAEFDLLFESFTDTQKQAILDYLCRNIGKDMPNILEEGEFLAGYLKKDFVEKLKQYGDFPNVTNIIFVDTGYKAKLLDIGETFIEMEPGNIASISEIPLLAERVTQSNSYSRYFYLYFDTSTKDSVERKREAKELKKAIKSFFENEVSSSVIEGEE